MATNQRARIAFTAALTVWFAIASRDLLSGLPWYVAALAILGVPSAVGLIGGLAAMLVKGAKDAELSGKGGKGR